MIVKIGKAEDNDYVANDTYVSRYHAILREEDNGDLSIEDLHSTNGTYVNGDRVMKKKITATDQVTLGEHYTLNIGEALKFDDNYSREFASLKHVYETYLKEKIRIQSSNQFKVRLFQSIPFVFIGLAGLVFAFFGRRNLYVVIASGLMAVCFPTLGIYLAARQSAKIPELLQNLANQLKIDYVCPKCGTFLGEIPWESLVRKKQCPVGSCHAKWVNN
ncbi:MAG: FHA domain-containing protein [Tannerella sp.]|jgi:hypothetical protein|nr:FHA domain-containing protein [Tannerella sp.]